MELFSYTPKKPRPLHPDILEKTRKLKAISELEECDIRELNSDCFNDYYLIQKCRVIGQYVSQKETVNMKLFCRYLVRSILSPDQCQSLIDDLSINKAYPCRIISQPLYLKNPPAGESEIAKKIQQTLEKKAIYQVCVPNESIGVLTRMFFQGAVRIWTNSDRQNTKEQYIKIVRTNLNGIKELVAKIITSSQMEKQITKRREKNMIMPLDFFLLQEFDRHQKTMIIKHRQQLIGHFLYLNINHQLPITSQHLHNYYYLLDSPDKNDEKISNFLLDIKLIIKNHLLANRNYYLKSLMHEKFKETKQQIFGIHASKNKRELLTNQIAADFKKLNIDHIIVVDDRANNLSAASEILSQQGFRVDCYQIAPGRETINIDDWHMIEKLINSDNRTAFLVDWDGVISDDNIRYMMQNIAIIDELRNLSII